MGMIDWQMHESVAAIAAIGVSPIVRIAANEGWMVKRRWFFAMSMECLLTPLIGALDSGAHGIVVPLLYTADDARRLVESAKFPPVGRRGFGSPFAMGSTGNVTGIEYLQQANEALLTIVQIETKEALENVRLIFCAH